MFDPVHPGAAGNRCAAADAPGLSGPAAGGCSGAGMLTPPLLPTSPMELLGSATLPPRRLPSPACSRSGGLANFISFRERLLRAQTQLGVRLASRIAFKKPWETISPTSNKTTINLRASWAKQGRGIFGGFFFFAKPRCCCDLIPNFPLLEVAPTFFPLEAKFLGAELPFASRMRLFVARSSRGSRNCPVFQPRM